MKLEKYREKRKFNHTKEPQGRRRKNVKGHLIFVIHKHAATNLHYDLRLEMEKVLKSWAIPKGPSLNPEERRLAIMVEDHPFDYKEFEGIIPEGNYGAGEVIIWDEGTYYVKKGLTKSQNEKLLIKGLDKGHISFYLEGKKLTGQFSLIRIPSRGENAWMLVKKKDIQAGEKDILLFNKSVKSGKSIEDLAQENTSKIKKKEKKKNSNHNPILLPRNLTRTSQSAKSTKKNEKSKDFPTPQNLMPMLATSVDKPFSNEDWLFEIKWDGYRSMAAIQNGITKLYSRNNKSFDQKFPSIKNALSSINANVVLDGEIVALDKKGAPSFQLLQNYKEKELNLIYYVFDILWLDGKDLRNLPLIDRKEILKQVIADANHSRITYSDHILEDGELFFKEVESNDLEGIIAKRKQGNYYGGKRTKEWLKIKTHKRQEAVICGYTSPRKSRKHFGSLILGVYQNGKLKYAGHSGGGFDQKTLESIKERLDKITTDSSPFKDTPKTNTKPVWVKPELVCEVKFTEWTQEGQMRHPVFLGIREDKAAKDVVKENEKALEPIVNKNVKNQTSKRKSNIKSTKKSNDKEVLINGKKLKITNLSKYYFPDEKYTKSDIIDYYQRISSYILPYLKNRPQSLNRHPNGIKGKNFFQKDVKDMTPDWIKTIEVPSESKGKIKYMLCQNKATLIYMANLGCIEINPWSSKINKLEYPDYLIIDLDPLEVDFELVVKTALIVKEVLDVAKIPAFIKTSGSKGMHILIPLAAKYTYHIIKHFAHIIVKIVHNKLPDITSLERSPKKRKNKVYLDYLQNNHGQTIAAPYCIRPRKGATVSTPLKWEEVNYNLHPSQFTIENIFERLKKNGDLLKGLLKHKGINIEKSLKKLENLL